MNPRRRLLLQLRRRLRVQRRFRVQYNGGTVFQYTCTTCGTAEDQAMLDPAGKPLYGGDEKALARFAAYQDQGGGVSGVCDTCTRRARDERYPLGGK